MGIDFTGLDAILQSVKYMKNKKNCLTLGRQTIDIPSNAFDYLLEKNNFFHLKDKYHHGNYCEHFLNDLGFENIESLDNSPYESASIIHNMNHPIPPHLNNKYDYIFDGGTTEHIFNTPQVCENIINLLNIDGIYLSVTPNNNLSGHGIYQFSPEFYLSAFSKKYGMEVQELYLARVGTCYEHWIDVNNFNESGGGRNVTRFLSNEWVYVIAIIKKISNDRLNIITNSPNQFSYENIDWKNV